MPEVEKPFPVSHSRMEAADCLHHLHELYILGKKVADNDPLVGGRFAHAVVEQYNKKLLKERVSSDFEIFEQIFDRLWNTGTMKESRYDEMRDMLTGFAERHVLDLSDTLGAEMQVALNWDLQETKWDADDVWFRGKLDLVKIPGRRAEITDYKTNYNAPSEAQMKKNMQGKIYAWALHVLNPHLEEFEVVYDYIRFGTKRRVTFTLDEIRPVEKRLRDFSLRINERIADPEAQWPATECDRCYICSLECPLASIGYSPTNTIERAIEVGMQIQALKRKSKKLNEDLKKFVKTRGQVVKIEGVKQFDGEPVEIPTGVYTFENSQSMSVDAAELVDFCLENGIDVGLLLKFEKKKFEKLNEDEIKEQIREMATFKDSMKFKFKKIATDLRGEGEGEEGEGEEGES